MVVAVALVTVPDNVQLMAKRRKTLKCPLYTVYSVAWMALPVVADVVERLDERHHYS